MLAVPELVLAVPVIVLAVPEIVLAVPIVHAFHVIASSCLLCL